MEAQHDLLFDLTVGDLLAHLFTTVDAAYWPNHTASAGITPHAFAVAIKGARPRLVAFAEKLVRAWPPAVQRCIDKTDVAEDIVDEALCAAWEHRDQFRGESSVCTWVHGCVKNVAKRRLRTLARRLRHEVPELKRPGATEDDEDDAAFAVADMAGFDPLPARRVRASITCPACGSKVTPGTACGECGLGLPRDLEPDDTRYRTGTWRAAVSSERRSGLLRAWAWIEDRILVRMAARRTLTKVLARQPAWLRAAFGRFLAREPLESLATDVGLSTRVLDGKFQAIMHTVLSRLDGDDPGGAHA